MIHTITLDDLPVYKKIEALENKITYLRDLLTSANEDVREDLRVLLRQAILTRSRLLEG